MSVVGGTGELRRPTLPVQEKPDRGTGDPAPCPTYCPLARPTSMILEVASRAYRATGVLSGGGLNVPR